MPKIPLLHLEPAGPPSQNTPGSAPSVHSGTADPRAAIQMSSSRRTLEGRKIAYSGAQSLGALLPRAASDGATPEAHAVEELAENGAGHGRWTRLLEPVAIWCGNIPESSCSEPAVRLLFGRFGQIRRVIVRRKPSPSMSWCLITYRSSASVKAALDSPVMVKGSDGNDVELAVELPSIEKELMDRTSSMDSEQPSQHSMDSRKPPTADGSGETSARSELSSSPSVSSQTTSGSPTPTMARRRHRTVSMPARRRSVVEVDVRYSLSPTAETGESFNTTESPSALAADQNRGRQLWGKVRKSSFRTKLAVAALFVQNDDENEKAAKRAVKDTLRVVRQQENSITATLKGLAQLYGGEMRGLDYRFKTEASLFRKLMSRVDKAVAEAAASKTAPPSPQVILTSILDVLRYTVVFRTKRYTSAVREMIHALKDHNYNQHRVKNFWGPGDGYQGINAVFVSPSGQAFELQLHTPESLCMKEEECHSSYEKFRTATDSRKMIQYWEEMVSLWDMVPVPDDVLEIPDVVQQKLEFDLSKLSESETAAIQHRKSLERVCRYPIEELHSRAVRAEAEIGSLMVYLMHKHGPGGSCEQKERRSAVRGQLSMLRQLVDRFIVADDNDDEQSGDANADDIPSAHRNRAASMSDGSFEKVTVGVKLARQQSVGSVDFKNVPALPDEPTMRDKLRLLECEFPPLKYNIVCNNENIYTSIVQGFLRDIASDGDYDIFAVNNWWDDLEKFGAVNARFLAIRHGLCFEVTFHTQASWDASTEHSEYMRRKFDTVIKTDVLFTDKPHLVEQVKSQMRREEMWRERWARIAVPDRALTIGTLRYAHIAAPEASVLNREAQVAVGKSHAAINRFQDTANKVLMGVRMNSIVHSHSQSSRSLPAHGSNAEVSSSVGSAWAEIVGAFFEERRDVAEMFDRFKAAYLAKRGSDHAAWQPLASRFAALEQQMIRMQEQLTAGQPRKDRSLSFVPMIATSTASALSSDRVQEWKIKDVGQQEERPAEYNRAVVDGITHVGGSSCPPPQAPAHSTAASSGAVAAMLRATPGAAKATASRLADGKTASKTTRVHATPATDQAPLPELLERLLRNQEAIRRMATGV